MRTFADMEKEWVNIQMPRYGISTVAVREMLQGVSGSCAIVSLDAGGKLPDDAAERLMAVAFSVPEAGIVYSDLFRTGPDGISVHVPLADWQKGSLRDDFDFGGFILLNRQAIDWYLSQSLGQFQTAGFYQMWLAVSRKFGIIHIKEPLYSVSETDSRKSGEKQFDYVNPRNRSVQIEMEAVCTEHLKCVGAFLTPDKFRTVRFEEEFEREASVIIPVRNRARTIEDAVRSALSQKTDFAFNVIVVDNHSTDGTATILERLSAEDGRLVHIIPSQTDLGIGGCWDLAIRDSRCGRFAVQLDSDDLYSSEGTLQYIVDKFHSEKCAMVIGSYRMCDFALNTLPPGTIDHREWTDDNGPNNALRINGLGAPRAFYTPVVRKIGFPNVSYGEDYAVAIAISRQYRIGRIYDELYLCRRWEGNSDAALSPEKVSANNYFKDSLRTAELLRRCSK